MKKLICMAICLLVTVASFAAEPLWQGKGRIALSSDGNEHDDDDWAATPMTLAILAESNLQDKVVLYTYSDHVWGSNMTHPNKHGVTAYEHMHLSALGAKYWFGFKDSEFICAVDNPDKAYDAMAREINLSSEDNPLFIIAAGPMQVVGEGINRSDASKHKYVYLISHSLWNDRHATKPAKRLGWDTHTEGWTWDAMTETFKNINFVHILDQNKGEGYDGFLTKKENFDWILTSPKRNDPKYKSGAWDFLYQRVSTCVKEKGTSYDVSDAGMALFLVTGEQKNSIQMLEAYMCK